MTEHKPDCPLHPNWTDETLVRGLKSCTCNADKPTPPNCPVDGEALRPRCVHAQCEHNVMGCQLAKPTSPAPTEAEVREARELLEKEYLDEVCWG